MLGGPPPARDVSAFELLRRPEVSYPAIIELVGAGETAGLDPRLPEQIRRDIEVRASYAGYIERAEQEIERTREHEGMRLPEDLDYAALAGLSHEVRQQLTAIRPATLGQAARVPGVTPAAVAILLVHLKRRMQRVA